MYVGVNIGRGYVCGFDGGVACFLGVSWLFVQCWKIEYECSWYRGGQSGFWQTRWNIGSVEFAAR